MRDGSRNCLHERYPKNDGSALVSLGIFSIQVGKFYGGYFATFNALLSVVGYKLVAIHLFGRKFDIIKINNKNKTFNLLNTIHIII